MSTQPRLTTASGIPVADNQNSLSAGPRGPLLLHDFHLIEKLQHFNRERIPERVVHAKGSAAYGTFTVTKDITEFTKAKLFSAVGKQTEVFLRFSTVGGERGSADTERDPRGFAGQPNYATVEAPLAGNQGFGHGDPGWALQGTAGRHDGRFEDDHYTQAGNLFRLMPAQEQQNLFDNIAGAIGGVDGDIIQRQLAHFDRADPAYGDGVRAALARRGVAAAPRQA